MDIESTFKIELKNGKWLVNDKPFAELDYTEKLMLQEFIYYARENYKEETPKNKENE